VALLLNMSRPNRVVERLLAARARARFVDADQRLWRLGDPGPSLDERIAEREVLAAVHEHWDSTPLPDIRGW
jgi:hypothetical protein